MRSESAASLSVPLQSMVTLGVEYWRLSRWLARVPDRVQAGPARHALRRIEELLDLCELEIVSMDDRPYDAGLAASVMDSVEDLALPAGTVVIDQTLSPMVLWKGDVVRNAEVTTRCGAAGQAGEK